ncbi:MAG: GNAT family N-acetyltransferase [Candidatus Lokiarchaeota archaeon]|nr:GNAT family N-acetyltransferase [Candidatus Lokiarchaeota archaeon]
MEQKEVPIFIDGENICFLPQSSDHIDLYVKWLNDPKVRKYSRNIIPVRVENAKRWFEPRERGMTNFLALEIWHKKDKKPIGNIFLTDIDWVNGWANVGLTIGEPDYWNKNIATEATELILEYAFTELNLHKLHGGVIFDNIGSWTVAEKTGFSLEGIQKHEFFVDGEFLDVKKYCILKEDWLGRKKE